MKQKCIKFLQRYATALRQHLKHGRDSSLLPAFRLGCEAVVLGLEAQERERHTISRHLQKEIASTQRLVGATVKSINRFTRKINLRDHA